MPVAPRQVIKPNTLCMIIVHSPYTLTLPEYLGRCCVVRSGPFATMHDFVRHVVYECEFPDGSRHWVDADALKPITPDGPLLSEGLREPEQLGFR